jgi:hypothetical protein
MRLARATIVSCAAGYAHHMTFSAARVFVVAILSMIGSATARAQAARDTTVAPSRAAAAPSRLKPPLSPKRAFLYSLVLPGLGQSRLDRGTSGALFASVELAALAMVRRSNADLQEVRRYKTDTLPSDFTVSGTTLTKTGTFVGKYGADLERTRRLHVEDWIAVIAFNHLFSGADSFVAAQLWDVPVSLTAAPRPGGAVLVATIRW